MMFFFKLVDADIAEACRVVEGLRQKAIDLKWLPVGDVVHLTDDECRDGDRLPGKFLLIAAGDTVLTPHEVIFFEAIPPGDEPRPFGLAAYPGHMEGSRRAVPTHLDGWQWVGVIRSSDVPGVKDFIHTAAELGLEVTASFSITHRSVVRSFPFHIDLPTQDFLWSMIVGAVRTPYPPLLPHRPTELQLRDDAIGHALRPWVERLGITCVLKDGMEAVEKALFEAGEEFYGPRSVEQ